MRPGGPGGQGYYGHRWYPSSYYPYYGGYYPYYGYPYYGYPYGGGHWSIGFSVGFGYGWPYYGPYPYAYAYPYPYPGYAYPYYWRGGVTVVPGDGDDDNREERDPAPREEIREVPETPTGSLRLRVTPRAARVYVDGALAGVVDEFDGLSSHLKIPAGPHTIEFRADGYESLRIDTTVEPNKTRTERVTLRKQAAAD